MFGGASSPPEAAQRAAWCGGAGFSLFRTPTRECQTVWRHSSRCQLLSSNCAHGTARSQSGLGQAYGTADAIQTNERTRTHVCAAPRRPARMSSASRKHRLHDVRLRELAPTPSHGKRPRRLEPTVHGVTDHSAHLIKSLSLCDASRQGRDFSPVPSLRRFTLVYDSLYLLHAAYYSKISLRESMAAEGNRRIRSGR